MKKIWEVAVPHACALGEGPLWDHNTQQLYWVDILKKEIHRFSPETNAHHIQKLDQMVGAIAINSKGGLVAALQNGIALINSEKNTVEMVAEPEQHLPDNRFNDGKCDPDGRFWAGTMSMTNQHGTGSLYTLEKDLSVSVKIKNVSCSNGLAWSPDLQTLYYIDSLTFEVVSYDFDVESGGIQNKKVIIRIPPNEGLPDGMTIDEEGMLWIAYYNGWKVARWDPNIGKELNQIRLPVSQVTSCAFGGKTLEDLYITTANTGLNEQQKEKQPLAGALFVIKNSRFKGMKAFEFQPSKKQD